MAGEHVEVSADHEAFPLRPSARLLRGRTLLEQNFHLIRHRLERLGRHSGLPAYEAEEFRSWALFKLVENDYRILSSWEGRSSFPTFLTVVLVNLMRDYRTHIWGKGRPSAAADGQVESRIEDDERARTEERLCELLAPLVQSLPAQDRLLLKLHYRDGLSMATISSLLGRTQRALCSIRDKCLKKLRRNLEEAGLSPDQVRGLLGCSRLEFAPPKLEKGV